LYKKQDEEKNEKRENVFFELDGNIAWKFEMLCQKLRWFS